MLPAIIDDVFRQLKEIIPKVNSVYIRNDNAGCYHCAFTLRSVYHVVREHAIELKRVASMSVEGDGSVLPMGWAFKSAGV